MMLEHTTPDATTTPAGPGAAGTARKPWETPLCEELAVRLSASEPRVGGDGGSYSDCTHS